MEGDAIRSAAAVDPAWLSAALAARGIGVGNALTSVVATPIGTGQMGDNVRYALTWRDDDPSLPVTVVAKFPSADETSRSTARLLDSYRQEVGFYRDLRHLVDVPVPHVHHVGWDETTHDFVLVMGDLAPAEQGDQLAGCDLERAGRAIDAIVGLHAPTWGRGRELAAEIGWLKAPSVERTELAAGLIGFATPAFAERYRHRLTADELEVGAVLAARYVGLVERVAAWADRHAAWTITHGDYRLDNLLFGDGDRGWAVTVVDWQTVSVGVGPSDVAYFCGAGLLPADRERHERDLVGRYTTGLHRRGVDITDDAVWECYVLGSASGYLMAVAASQIVERTERGDDMFVAMASRHAHQIRSLGLLDLLETT